MPNLTDLVLVTSDVGSTVQGYDAALQSIAGLTTTADRMIYTTAADTYAVATLTSAGRAILDDADATAQRTTLGLGTIATQNSNSVSITGGSITGITDLAITDGGTGASTAAAARTNLGLAIGSDVQAYSAVLQNTTASFTTADETKLDGIETGADVTDAGNVNPLVDAHLNTSTATTGEFLSWTGSDYDWVAAPSPTLQATASGALSSGAAVVINEDGTVSVVPELLPTTFGTPTALPTANSLPNGAVYDSVNGVVVLAYKDSANSNAGTAVVGTISGTSVSFGTPVVYLAGNSNTNAITYDANAGKVVIFYADPANSNFATVVVGTVSGTSISFGTPVVFQSASLTQASLTYDENAQKVVLFYRRAVPVDGLAAVGTVSGTSISFGTPVIYETDDVSVQRSVYDSLNQKVVVIYSDQGNSNATTAVVGTVSGTSISFGTPVVVKAASDSFGSVTFDRNANKVVYFYEDSANSNRGTAVVGTVSGTSISFGTPVVFETGSTLVTAATYDANAQKVVVAYRDGGNSNHGTVAVGTVSGTSVSFEAPVVFRSGATTSPTVTYDSGTQKVFLTYVGSTSSPFPQSGLAMTTSSVSSRLTSENFIGFSQGSYSDSSTATVQIVGAVNESQSGLTAGQKYYVQTDGSLSVTPGSPEVYAGVAVSPTKIIVKG